MRYLRVGPPKWTGEFITINFYDDYPTDRESGPGPVTKRWMTQSRNWMKAFLEDIMKCKPEDILWRKGYYEWYMHAKIGEQWWYFSTGDIRFKITKSMLVRTASGPKDYTGGRNQFVQYDDSDFAGALRHILTPMRI